MKDEHAQFSGSIPAAYDRYLGPILFQPYAEDLAARLQVAKNGSVLELACGTGILTRVLRTHLPSTVKLTATDLNEPMFRHAAAKFRKDEAVQWLQADACSLPFGDRMFDAVVCQFGIMFVPDKALAAREARRVLKPGGLFLFNVWDAMEHNELGQLAHQTIASYFDKDPPAFYEVPFSYHDQDEIKACSRKLAFKRSRPKSSPKPVPQAGRKTQPQASYRGIRWPWRSPSATRRYCRSSPRPWLKRSRTGSEKQTFVLR